MTEDIPSYYKNKTPRNLGDENLEPIQTLEYAWYVISFLTQHHKQITHSDGTTEVDISEEIIDKIVEKTIGQIHRNKKYPENHNVFLRNDKLYAYENNKWSIIPKTRFEEITDRTYKHIMQLLKDAKELNKKIINKN